MTTTETQIIRRAATFDDLEHVVELLNMCSLRDIGVAEMSSQTLHDEWSAPKFNLARDTWTIWSSEGNLLGYIDAFVQNEPAVRNFLWLRVHPDFEFTEIGTELIQWGQQRVQDVIQSVPLELQVTVSSGIVSTQSYYKQLFHDHGFSLQRHFLRMHIDLDHEIPEPAIPSQCIIRPYHPEHELEALILAHETAFRDHWGHIDQPLETLKADWEHWRTESAYDESLWFVAVAGDQIVGYSLCSAFTDEDPNKGWINILGVDAQWRKHGLGLALLQHSFIELQQRGKTSAGLGVDGSSLTGATRLYERAGMRSVRQYDNYEKILRPGKIISTE